MGAWRNIQRAGQMRPGKKGIVGAGIYWAASPAEAQLKSPKGSSVVLFCPVALGHVKSTDQREEYSIDRLQSEGYDSVMFTAKGGVEFVVYDSNQIDVSQCK